MGLAAHLQCIDRCGQRAMQFAPDDAALADWIRNYVSRHRYRLACDLELVSRRVAPRARVVEFGAAPFLLTLALQEVGYRVKAIDIAPERFSRLISECDLDVQKVDFETEPIPFPDDAFDAVLFNEVFEHLRIDLIGTMTAVRRVLKPEGLLFLSTPNHRSLVGCWTLLWHQLGCHVETDLYREYEKLKLFGHMGHVREYTAKEVSGFLTKVGLHTTETLFRYHGPPRRDRFSMLARSWIERAVGTVLPSSRPLFSLVCRKTV